MHKLLHTCLQAPDFELDGDQFVGAHDGVLAVDPALLQEASVGLLGLKIPQVLQVNETGENYFIVKAGVWNFCLPPLAVRVIT